MRRNLLALVPAMLLAACASPVAGGEAATIEPASPPAATDELTIEPEVPTQAPSPRRLGEWPIVPAAFGRARAIYEEGLAQGRNPQVFTKVGDCLTASDFYLFPIGKGEYDLGQYGHLQAAIDHFSQATVREIEGRAVNSFSNPSLTASCGFNSAGPLDPIWADPRWCEDGETPLACELRVSNASFVLILLGMHDMYYTTEKFEGYLDAIVAETVQTGVVPILFTFPARLDKLDDVERYNQVIVDIAVKYDVPLANLWLAMRDLPNQGIAEGEVTHPSMPAGGCTTCFSEDGLMAGATMQNLVGLEALSAVWRAVTE